MSPTASIQDPPIRLQSTGTLRHDSPSTQNPEIPQFEEESEVPRSRGIRWLLASLSFVILTPVVSVLLGLYLHVRDFQYLDESTYDGRTVIPSQTYLIIWLYTNIFCRSYYR